MPQHTTRIRWNQEERNTLLATYRRLHAQNPDQDVAELFAAAQKTLPPKRRRNLDYGLRSWLASETGTSRSARRSKAAASATVATETPAGNTGSADAPRRGPPEAAKPETGAGDRSKMLAAAGSAEIAKVLVERGSEILAEILASERVRTAVRALLRSAWPLQDDSSRAVPPKREQPAARSNNGRLQVLIAGLESREGKALAGTYDDALALTCWSTEDGLEQLRDQLENADVVIGMTTLSQPVEQTLRRHARRYLRNTRGVAGLRSELADLALSGHGGARDEA